MLYEKIAAAITACALIGTVVDAAHRNWTSEAREPFHYTFSTDKTLDVDNVDGTIQVIGDGGNTIRVEGERVDRGEDQQALDRAKREVKLDVNEKDGIAQLYVNGPFRNEGRSTEDHGFHDHYEDHRYEVTYNFTVHVPRETALRLSTVNGDVKTEQTNGKFDVHGVNGSVTMSDVAGYGSLRTVNGRTSISFRESPKQASDFKTVNGAIEATFPPDFAADLHLKTLNGQAFTDFDTTAALPSTAQAGERKNGRFVYRSNRDSTVRIGSGGPELSFDTVNGDIRIKKGTH
ncbi:MAG TPA: hypothetical protein VHY84_02185 [Bryobacteraceae bacterium]|jgi:hypothetical protein|nr:hypothetical protein [Bryobacteraceae bacterium]